jgi:glycosyltransferase involved in cell wall biosynthesis
MSPKFSFIIPVLNEQDIIADCISSILPQLKKGDEILVVDNGSTDNTIKNIKSLNVRLIHESQKGISHARNRGAKEAKGDYLCFIDADGQLTPYWLDFMRSNLSKKSPHALVGMNVFTHKKHIKFIWYNTYTAIAYFFVFLQSLLNTGIFIGGNNLAIKKEIFNKLNGFDPLVAEDYWFTKKFRRDKKLKAVFVPRAVVLYSSRGFDHAGYLRTIIYWIVSSLKKRPQEGYSYKTKH